jgi:hypothetical protein
VPFADACDARHDPAGVIQHRLGDARPHPKLCHPARGGAVQIAHAERGDHGRFTRPSPDTFVLGRSPGGYPAPESEEPPRRAAQSSY